VEESGKMFPSKLPLLLLGFLVAGTALTSIRAMPIEEYDYPINGIENEIFEEEISADKNGIVDGNNSIESVRKYLIIFMTGSKSD
ncbi:hypothetical protein AVEN_151906-1, partial [Araneus ventricosus]